LREKKSLFPDLGFISPRTIFNSIANEYTTHMIPKTPPKAAPQKDRKSVTFGFDDEGSKGGADLDESESVGTPRTPQIPYTPHIKLNQRTTTINMTMNAEDFKDFF